jgi:hypothetical protein
MAGMRPATGTRVNPPPLAGEGRVGVAHARGNPADAGAMLAAVPPSPKPSPASGRGLLRSAAA